MKYAVIRTGGKQYRVAEGDVIEIDRLASEEKKVSFNQVLLLVDDAGVKFGKPTVDGEKVEGTLLENFKGEKLRVSKFKAKARYRRTIGFRAHLSRVQIDKITGVEKKAEIKEKPVKAEPKVKVVKEEITV